MRLKLLRIFIVGMSCLVTGLAPDSSVSFFRSLLIFSAGLFYDYSSMVSVAYAIENKNDREYSYQRKISSIGVALSLVFSILAIIGLFNIIYVDTESSELIIKSSPDLVALSFQISYKTFARIMYILPTIACFEMVNKHKRAVMVPNIYK